GVSVAAGLALAWVPLALVTSVLRLAVFAGLPTSSPALGAQYLDYLLRFPMGRSELAALVLTALVATVLPLVRTLTGVGGAALLAVAAVVPLAATGHASAGDFPESAVVTLAVHLVAAAVWVGGLLGVLLLQPQLGDVRAVVAARFSGLALVCWTAVAATGLINLALALHDVSDLASVWGAALITKVVLLLVLGVFGGWHRRRTLPQLAVLPSAFRRWAGAEAIVMAATLGVAVGVTVSAPPPEAAEDRQLLDVPWWLLGFPAPPPLTAASWFTAGRLDLLWAGVAVSLALAYLLGVRRLRRAAYAWAGRRTLTWLAGCVVLLYATSGAPGLYARVDYTASVTQVVLLALVAAPLLVAGRPWQLVELTVSPRTDGSRGLREWAAVAARPSSVQRLASLPAALALLVVLLVGMSLSPVAEATVRTWPAHTATVAVALGAGLLLFAALRASSGASGDQASARQRAGVMAVLAGVLAMLGASAA
ncbi:MAG: cytochrome c oxidase assembly protein, partial [Actinomycetota bacterium]